MATRLTSWSTVTLSAVLALSALGLATTATAADEPVFHLPFACGETWTASTRDGHSPTIDAVDFNRPNDDGAEVLAGADGGKVTKTGSETGYGNYVKVRYPGKVDLLFAHLQSPTTLQLNDPVDAQTIVGRVGSTGLGEGSTAYHLHYEQRKNDELRPVVIEGVTWQVGTHVADDKDDLTNNPGIAHVSRNCSASTATAPSGKPRSRPALLPARVPWTAGQSHKLVSSYDRNAAEGFGLVFDIKTPDTVYPVYPGEVIYAGCGSGRSAPLGRMVIVRRTFGEHTFDTVYGHLATIDPAIADASVLTPRSVGVNQPLGTVGSLTSIDIDACSGETRSDRLYVGGLRDAEVFASGEISGGQPVYSEPMVGRGAYEGLRWWSGPLTATDLDERVGEPWGRWAKTSEKDGAAINYGDTVTLAAEVNNDVPIKELRFTAYYKGWPRPKSAARLDGFSENQTWRILAVCRPPGVGGEPEKAKDCRWDGTATEATVTFEWDPTLPVNEKVTPWQPLTTVAISEKSTACVPVTYSFDVFDQAGYRRNAPGGVKKAKKCPKAVASSGTSFVLARQAEPPPDPVLAAEKKTRQQDRWAYLLPPRPPAAPGKVRFLCESGGFSGTSASCLLDLGDDRATALWQDRSQDEDGFRVYARWTGVELSGKRCRRAITKIDGPWRDVATLPPGSTSWRVGRLYRRGDLPEYDFRRTLPLGTELTVVAFNEVGESRIPRILRLPAPNPGDFEACGTERERFFDLWERWVGR